MISFIKDALRILLFILLVPLMLGAAALLVEVFAENTIHRITGYIIAVPIITPIATRISEHIL